jgi:hypothetical protein
MKTLYLVLISVLCTISLCCAQNKDLLLDDFEGQLIGGPDGTVDFGAGNGSSVQVAAATDIKNTGAQSIKVTYDAISDGYMWVARGFGLDAKNAGWLVKPADIDWKAYKAFTFSVYGSGSKAAIAFDIKDNGNEIWRFMVTDDFQGWKKIVCPFDKFFVRGDWQPDNADKNAFLDFPVKSYQFEPRPVAKGVVYFDTVSLTTSAE